MKTLAALFLLVPGLTFAEDALKFTQPEIPLWTEAELGAEATQTPDKWNPSTDGFHRITNVHKPSIFVFLPPKEKATGAAVLICPGGGHRYLVMDLEGSLVAEKLNAMGITAFVLKSRLSRAEGSTYKTEIHSLQDAQRAMAIIRGRAKEWFVDPKKVGIMGFSAGGEIAALAETKYDTPAARPDFAVLAYPGIRSSANFNITKDTPPTFLVVASDDSPAAAVAEYYTKLKAAGVPAEVHIYTKGGHGFGMTGRNADFRNLPVSGWPERFREWIADQGLLKKTLVP